MSSLHCNYYKHIYVAQLSKISLHFQDVDCKDVESVESIITNGTVIANGTVSDDETIEEFDDSGIYNLTNTDGTLNVSQITADEVSRR